MAPPDRCRACGYKSDNIDNISAESSVLISGPRQRGLSAPGGSRRTALIAYGFLARVAAGPTLSPLGQLVTRVITPRLPVPPRPVPGPPKRFAQAIGAVLSSSAALLALALGLPSAGYALLGLLAAAATLEAAFGVCLGCRAFAILMRIGVIPAQVCERCSDLTRPAAQRA
jgi:hypothetical protein